MWLFKFSVAIQKCTSHRTISSTLKFSDYPQNISVPRERMVSPHNHTQTHTRTHARTHTHAQKHTLPTPHPPGWSNRQFSNAQLPPALGTFRLFRSTVPNLFGTGDQFCGRQFFQVLGVKGWGHGFRMIQMHSIYSAL